MIQVTNDNFILETSKDTTENKENEIFNILISTATDIPDITLNHLTKEELIEIIKEDTRRIKEALTLMGYSWRM